MTVRDHLKVLRQRIVVVLLCVVFGAAAAATIYMLQPSRYTAGLQLYVTSPVPTNSDDFVSAAQLAQDRVASYTALTTSEPVLRQVIRQLNLATTPQDLESRVTATAVDEAVVIEVTATDRSAPQAAAIANTVGDVLSRTVDGLERPRGPGASPIVVRAVQPAPVPTEQSILDLDRLLAVGLLLGLALGVAMAFIRHNLDSSVKRAEQLADLINAPNLGGIAQDGRVGKRPLLVQEDPQGRLAEDIRRLRTNLQFVDAGNAHKVLIITSALPAEGKTTVSINLAAALGSAGGRVLLIDADLRRPKAAELLGVDSAVGLTSVLARRIAINDVLYAHDHGRFDVLPAGPIPPNPSELLASRQMREVLDELRSRYDVILIDTSPLLPVTDAAALARSTDGAVLVCRAGRTSRTQVRLAADALRQVEAPLRGGVLTMLERSSLDLPSYARTYRAGAAADPHPDLPSRMPVGHEDETTTTMSVNGQQGGHHRPSPSPRSTNGRHTPAAGTRSSSDRR